MHLNDFERDLFRDLAFFSEDTGFLGHELRPLSLASYRATEIMGLTLLHENHQLDAQAETREIAAYLWLHSAPLGEISSALWSGAWRGIMETFTEPMPSIVEAFREWRTRLLMCLQAADVVVRARPRPAKDDTPRDVISPGNLAFTVAMVCHFTGFPRQQVKWHIFLPEAMQYYHTALRWNGAWTVAPGREVKVEDFADMTPDWMRAEPQ